MVRTVGKPAAATLTRAMQSVLGALIGVPATALVAGGIGVVGVTIWSRLGITKRSEPIRWPHLWLGVAMFFGGVGLVWLEIVLFGPG